MMEDMNFTNALFSTNVNGSPVLANRFATSRVIFVLAVVGFFQVESTPTNDGADTADWATNFDASDDDAFLAVAMDSFVLLTFALYF